MSSMPSINPRIVNALYAEALLLTQEVRTRFDSFRMDLDSSISDFSSSADNAIAGDDGEARIAISCEALRTTNRMMHCMAWLLNHRAHFSGELSLLQLRRQGRLIDNFPRAESATLALMPADLQRSVLATQRLYERVARLDRVWRNGSAGSKANAILRLRERVSERIRTAL